MLWVVTVSMGYTVRVTQQHAQLVYQYPPIFRVKQLTAPNITYYLYSNLTVIKTGMTVSVHKDLYNPR